MNLFESIKLKLKKKSPVIEKLETSSNVLKELRQVTAYGNISATLSIHDFPLPTGICANPISKELEECIKRDEVGQLLRNPIHRCIFYNNTTGYCFFAGFCSEKQEINNIQIECYKEQLKAQIYYEGNNNE